MKSESFNKHTLKSKAGSNRLKYDSYDVAVDEDGICELHSKKIMCFHLMRTLFRFVFIFKLVNAIYKYLHQSNN